MKRNLRHTFLTAALLAAVILILVPDAATGRILKPGGSGSVHFPFPPALKENVDFWRDVFARYKISEVVFHDEYRLGRRYGVLQLGGDWMADRGQKKLIRAYKRKIQAILLALAEGRTPPAGDAGLVGRIRKMYAGQPRSELRKAAFSVRGQPGLRERFLEGYIRSGRYTRHFRLIFMKHDLPEDLILLPHVESGFRSKIYRHAGALGLWQFTRSTGRRYMRVDGTVDGRRDPFLAAEAAAKLLKRNYENLKSWPLAITAYNHGSLGMRRAVKQVGSSRIDLIVKNYKSRTFGFASRNFYAEFLAAVDIHKNAKKYFGVVRRDAPLQFDEFHLPGYIRFEELTRRINVDISVLTKMNPALRASVIRGRRKVPRGYPLRLPPGEKKRVRQAYYQFAQSFPAEVNDEGAQWVLVRPGDTLGAIARRNRVRLKDLMMENGLERSLIIVGDRLRLPAKGASGKSKIASAKPPAPAPKKKSRTQLVRLETPMVSKAPEKTERAPEKPKAIKAPAARKAAPPKKTPVRTAAASPPPKLDEEAIWAVSEYDLPVIPNRGSRYRREALIQALAVAPSGGEKMGWIRVQENETIGHLSRWLRVSSRQIRRMNGIRSSRRVRMGKKIRVSFRRVPKTDFIESRMAYHEGIKKNFFNKYAVSRVSRHKLKRGENVWTLIVRTYKIPLWLVRQYNTDKNLRRIAAGEELSIPVVERRKF